MTSERKIAANRRNASSSTGPRTLAGRARSSRNAERHGLSIPIGRDCVGREQIEKLVQLFDLPSANLSVHRHAWIAAEAELELARIRLTRMASINRKAQSADKIAKNDSPLAPDDELRTETLLLSTGLAISKNDLVDALTELEKLERYERRALSRRKKALRVIESVKTKTPT